MPIVGGYGSIISTIGNDQGPAVRLVRSCQNLSYPERLSKHATIQSWYSSLYNDIDKVDRNKLFSLAPYTRPYMESSYETIKKGQDWMLEQLALEIVWSTPGIGPGINSVPGWGKHVRPEISSYVVHRSDDTAWTKSFMWAWVSEDGKSEWKGWSGLSCSNHSIRYSP